MTRKPVTRRTRSRSRSPVAAGSGRDPMVQPGMSRMFVTTVPGLGPMVSRELGRLPDIVVRDSGFDGRSDVVLFETARASRSAVVGLGLAEDVFVGVGRTLRAEGDRSGWIAGRLWRPERVQRALSVWAEEVRPLAGAMTFRVIARVLQERSFLRTDLRRQLTGAIQRDRPRWRVQDPAQIEVWVSEYAQGRFVAGLRLYDRQLQWPWCFLRVNRVARPSTHAAVQEPSFVNWWQLAGRRGVSTSTLTPYGPPGGTLLALLFGWVTPAAWNWPTRVSRRVCPICHSDSSTASRGTCTPGCGRCSGR
jgi:hypothetical protein